MPVPLLALLTHKKLMNWHKLKNNQCPSCRTLETLTQSLVSDKYECPQCGFHITIDKFNSLVSSFYRKERAPHDEVEDNQSGLSNL